ncbi:hypothetical protein THIX_90668 [Thiomonas sp. X19]|nr:hypothetical protein THIX_90668 [Thiomonas sp. X19]
MGWPDGASAREQFHTLPNFRLPHLACLREIMDFAQPTGLGFVSHMKITPLIRLPDLASEKTKPRHMDRAKLLILIGGQGRNRTADTRIFNP